MSYPLAVLIAIILGIIGLGIDSKRTMQVAANLPFIMIGIGLIASMLSSLCRLF